MLVVVYDGSLCKKLGIYKLVADIDVTQITYIMPPIFRVLSNFFFSAIKKGVGHLLVVVKKPLYETFLHSLYIWHGFAWLFAVFFSLMTEKVDKTLRRIVT